MSAKQLAKQVRKAIAKKTMELVSSHHEVVILPPNTTIEALKEPYNENNLYIETIEG